MECNSGQSDVFVTSEKRELFLNLYKKALASGLTEPEIASLPALLDIRVSRPTLLGSWLRLTAKYLCLVLGFLLLSWLLDWPVNKTKLAQVARLSSVVPEEFETIYAYSGKPAVVTDAATNWSALEVFSFQFFKELYSEDSSALPSVEMHCQFFPYKTEFRSLREVFRMTADRVHTEEGAKPWYIGWSNCDPAAGNVLRQHYQRPYFLPKSAESSKTDWMFMGSPGYGAHMHVDDVHLPSWQAQIKGTKRWTLEPPPECFLQCTYRIEVDVRPGEIIVLDTNKWFHSTLNVGKDISITIGSEFD